ncbi:hypothetical protein CTEN210_00076 [Chaetoceros tenuissimus]|uniref:Uncharacterized protein n=1 Tax=Chaetoceros tenuissimus TaxID=426638 RepID=A0AAD3CDK1_9STRA|nr:hypothetical protein CTEN210_00076 [Chaetoceros tenuissimus]
MSAEGENQAISGLSHQEFFRNQHVSSSSSSSDEEQERTDSMQQLQIPDENDDTHTHIPLFAQSQRVLATVINGIDTFVNQITSTVNEANENSTVDTGIDPGKDSKDKGDEKGYSIDKNIEMETNDNDILVNSEEEENSITMEHLKPSDSSTHYVSSTICAMNNPQNDIKVYNSKEEVENNSIRVEDKCEKTVEHLQLFENDQTMSTARNELEIFQEYSNRDVFQERKEVMKQMEEKIHDTHIQESSNISCLQPNIAENDIITTKKEFSRAMMKEIEEENVIRLLRIRSAHLPGNNWAQDWLQYMQNNHPLFGLCFHHKLHPLRFNQRIFIFIASLSFGVLASNCVYLYFMTSETFDQEMFKLYIELKDGQSTYIQVTKGMLSLWTYNGLLHAIFDLALWYIAACGCFTQRANFRKYVRFGRYTVLAICATVVALAGVTVLYRITKLSANEIAEQEGQGGNVDKDEIREEIFETEVRLFLISYAVDLALTWFALYPALVTVLFSGVFGCIPGMGGRPAHVVRENKRLLGQRDEMFDHLEIV